MFALRLSGLSSSRFSSSHEHVSCSRQGSRTTHGLHAGRIRGTANTPGPTCLTPLVNPILVHSPKHECLGPFHRVLFSVKTFTSSAIKLCRFVSWWPIGRLQRDGEWANQRNSRWPLIVRLCKLTLLEMLPYQEDPWYPIEISMHPFANARVTLRKKKKKIVARSIMPMFLADRIANYSAYFHALIQIPEARCGGC